MFENKVEYVQALNRDLLLEREKYSLFLSLNAACFFEYDSETGDLFFSHNDSFKRMDNLVIRVSAPDFVEKTGIFAEDYPVFLNLLNGKKDNEKTIRFLEEDGEYSWCQVRVALIQSSLEQNQMIGCIRNKERKFSSVEQRLRRMKSYDTLTGMLTSQRFKDEADRLRTENPDTKYALIYCDIDNFKYINDSYGYQFGDCILHEFAEELMNFFKMKATFCRDSADKFIVLYPYVNKDEVKELVLLFNQQFHEIEKEKYSTVNVSITAGVYFLKNDDDILIAIDHANATRKEAKKKDNVRCSFYSDELQEKQRKEQEISNDMEDALKNEEFLVYLQPKVDLLENRLAGAEALVRWKRKSGEIVPPDDFIPLFEKNGFIIQLDYYVYEKVCQIMKHWQQEGKDLIPISINVSRLHLKEKDFIEKICSLVEKYEIPAEKIELELTESIFSKDIGNTVQIMNDLRTYGFKVSIDDFGAGYSSLTLLKDVKSDVIKLDKEFFRHGEMKEQEKIIVSSIIQMAKQLDMAVISEGIETETQMEFLKEIRCDMVQGYFYARPMPIEKFESFMQHELENK